MNLAECIRMSWCRLRRIGHSRGFGIQSPFAYRMVTEVLCQRRPYHLYADLVSLMPDLKGNRLKVCRLLMRLANYCQSPATFVAVDVPAEEKAYVLAGCRHTRFVDKMDGCRLVVVRATLDSVNSVLDAVHIDMVVAMTDISEKGKPKPAWQQLKGAASAVVSFDLMDVGVVFFDPKLPHMSYQMNL